MPKAEELSQTARTSEADFLRYTKAKAEQREAQLVNAPMVASLTYSLQFIFNGDIQKYHHLMHRGWKSRYKTLTRRQLTPEQYDGDEDDSDIHKDGPVKADKAILVEVGSEDCNYDEDSDSSYSRSWDESTEPDSTDEEDDRSRARLRVIGLDMRRILEEYGTINFPRGLINWDPDFSRFKRTIFHRLAYNVGGGFGSALKLGMKGMTKMHEKSSLTTQLVLLLRRPNEYPEGSSLRQDLLLTCAEVCVAKCAEELLAMCLNYYVEGAIDMQRARLKHRCGQALFGQKVKDRKEKEVQRWKRRSTKEQRDGLRGLCPKYLATMFSYSGDSNEKVKEFLEMQNALGSKNRKAGMYYKDGSWSNRVFGLFNWTRPGQRYPDPLESKSRRTWDKVAWRETTKEIYGLIFQFFGRDSANVFVDEAIRTVASRYLLIIPNYELEKLFHLSEALEHDGIPVNSAHRIKFITPMFGSSTKVERVNGLGEIEALYDNLKDGKLHQVSGWTVDGVVRHRKRACNYILDHLATKGEVRSKKWIDRIITNVGSWQGGDPAGCHQLKRAEKVFKDAERARLM